MAEIARGYLCILRLPSRQWSNSGLVLTVLLAAQGVLAALLAAAPRSTSPRSTDVERFRNR